MLDSQLEPLTDTHMRPASRPGHGRIITSYDSTRSQAIDATIRVQTQDN